jgi:N-acetylmuramoyl-L-alanine amidase
VLRVAAALLAPILLAACGGTRGTACAPCARAAPISVAPPSAPRPADEPADPDRARRPPGVFVPDARPWKVIVLHHSASAVGGAARFDEWHRARGWDGVGYDFVVGNGSDTPDGSIEVTFRWREQRDGAHAKGWNDLAIGICLVGNFEESDPTPAQLEAAARLVRHLRRRFGIPAPRVVRHGALGATLCPGRRLDLPALVRASEPPAPGAAP